MSRAFRTPAVDELSAMTVTDVQATVHAAPSTSELFLNFLRLGVTAFGGPSMVAYIRKLAVERKGWLSAREFSEGVAFCQMVPGATAMQTAAYVGLHQGGVAGAAASYLGFGLPAFCLMLVFAVLYAQTGSLPRRRCRVQRPAGCGGGDRGQCRHLLRQDDAETLAALADRHRRRCVVLAERQFAVRHPAGGGGRLAPAARPGRNRAADGEIDRHPPLQAAPGPDPGCCLGCAGGALLSRHPSYSAWPCSWPGSI